MNIKCYYLPPTNRRPLPAKSHPVHLWMQLKVHPGARAWLASRLDLHPGAKRATWMQVKPPEHPGWLNEETSTQSTRKQGNKHSARTQAFNKETGTYFCYFPRCSLMLHMLEPYFPLFSNMFEMLDFGILVRFSYMFPDVLYTCSNLLPTGYQPSTNQVPNRLPTYYQPIPIQVPTQYRLSTNQLPT